MLALLNSIRNTIFQNTILKWSSLFAIPFLFSFWIATGAGASPLGKASSPVALDLDAPEGLPATAELATTLVASIRANQNIAAHTRYQWRLPEGVTLVSGSLEGDLPQLSRNQSLETTILVRGLGTREQPRNVFFTVSMTLENQPIGITAIFSSHPPSTPEAAEGPAPSPMENGKSLRKSQPDANRESRSIPRGLHF